MFIVSVSLWLTCPAMAQLSPLFRILQGSNHEKDIPSPLPCCIGQNWITDSDHTQWKGISQWYDLQELRIMGRPTESLSITVSPLDQNDSCLSYPKYSHLPQVPKSLFLLQYLIKIQKSQIRSNYGWNPLGVVFLDDGRC